MHRTFKSVLFISLLILLSTVALAVSPTGSFIIKDRIDFSDYRGKWVVISYWATWCENCMEEIPELNAFYRAHRDNVVMLGVNYEDTSGTLRQHIQESGVQFPTLAYDPKQHFGVRDIQGLPTILLIGPDGQLKKKLVGTQTREDLEEATGL